MNKISTKIYVCPLCGNESKQSTNHTLEIYVQCPKCSCSTLYPKEDSREFVPTFVLRTYEFHFDKAGDCEGYKKLVSMLSDKKRFVSYHHNASTAHELGKMLEKNDGSIISVNDIGQFEGQYVTNIGRLHDWFEFEFANSNIKKGYYLERIS